MAAITCGSSRAEPRHACTETINPPRSLSSTLSQVPDGGPRLAIDQQQGSALGFVSRRDLRAGRMGVAELALVPASECLVGKNAPEERDARRRATE